MPSNPVESNFVTRIILGFVVITAMFTGGAAVASVMAPSLRPIGILLGAFLTFVAFSIWYTKFSDSFDSS